MDIDLFTPFSLIFNPLNNLIEVKFIGSGERDTLLRVFFTTAT